MFIAIVPFLRRRYVRSETSWTCDSFEPLSRSSGAQGLLGSLNYKHLAPPGRRVVLHFEVESSCLQVVLRCL